MDLVSIKAKQLQVQRGGLPNTFPTKTRVRDFHNFANTHQRNELPSKYNVRQAPATELETVISKTVYSKFGHEQKSPSMRILEQHLNKGSKAYNSEPKPFYYTNRNDLMSMNEFFKVFKYSEYQRAQTEKQELRDRIEINRQKINKMKASPSRSRSASPGRSPMGSPHQSHNTTTDLLSNKRSRPASSRPLRSTTQDYFTSNNNTISPRENTNAPGIPSSSPAHKIIFKRTRPQTASVRVKGDKQSLKDFYVPYPELTEEDEHLDNVSDDAMGVPRQLRSPMQDTADNSNSVHKTMHLRLDPQKYHGILGTEDSQISNSVSHGQSYVRGLSKTARSRQKIVLNPEPKFTAKEIYRHLAYLTVTPQKMKKDAFSTEVEQHYIGIFRDHKGLDKSVEMSMRKNESIDTTRTLNTLLVDNSLPHYMQKSYLSHRPMSQQMKASPRDLGATSTDSMSRNRTTNKLEDEKYSQTVRNNINKNIQHIDKLLKEGSDLRRPDSAMARIKAETQPQKATVKKFSAQLANRVPLRKEIAKKYQMQTILQRNKNLCMRMKTAKDNIESKTQATGNQVSYDNTKYINYFHL